MTRKRAYGGARIATKDGRRGTVISSYSDGLGSWWVCLDQDGPDLADGDLVWIKRADFCLLGEEHCPW